MTSYEFTDEVNAIVLDVGTYQVKAGYAGEDAPKFICPSVRCTILYSLRTLINESFITIG